MMPDCDEANGCIQIVPGSHEWPVLCTVQADTSVSFTDVTVPLPENLGVTAAGPAANVPLDIRVVPLEQAPGAAPTTRFRATATSPQVAKITVRTN